MADELDDLLKEFDDNLEDDKGNKGTEDTKALQEKITLLEKEKAGLLNETKAQRKKRQETESKLEKLTETVANALKQRTAAVADPAAAASKARVDGVLKFDYDEDGNPIAKEDQIRKVVSPEVDSLKEKIANLEAILQASVQSQESSAEADRVINAIVGSDERFSPAYTKYQTARKWIEDKVVEYQKENNIGGYMTSGQALDYVFDDEVEAEFAGKFPGLNLERVVTAEDSQRHFKNTLASIADAMSPKGNDDSKGKFRSVLGKPSGLGKAANAKGADLSIEERLHSLQPADILGMDEKSVKSLEALLAKSEME